MDSLRIALLMFIFLFLQPAVAMSEQRFAISCNTIQSLHVEYNKTYWSLVVKLTAEETQKFHSITAENLGEFIRIRFEGETLLRTRAYEPIESGIICLRAPTKEKALRLAEKICSSKLENEAALPFEKLPPSTALPNIQKK